MSDPFAMTPEEYAENSKELDRVSKEVMQLAAMLVQGKEANANGDGTRAKIISLSISTMLGLKDRKEMMLFATACLGIISELAEAAMNGMAVAGVSELEKMLREARGG